VAATNDEHPLDVSNAAALDHVRGRLADEFGSRITAADITRYVEQAHADLGHPSPVTLPELLERLVRVRLLDRIGGPPDSGGRWATTPALRGGGPTCSRPVSLGSPGDPKT